MDNMIRIGGRPRGLLLAYSVRPALDGWHCTELRDESGNVYWKRYKTVRYAKGESEEWYQDPEEPSSSINPAK